MTGRARAGPGGILVVRGGLVVYASEGAAALLGRTVGELVGRPFEETISPGQRAVLLDRYARRLRGEPVPVEYEVTVALPGGETRLVEGFVEQDGEDVLVHLRDAGVREARRQRLEAVASLGAGLPGEFAEDAIHARVRDGLWELGLTSALLRAEPDGVRVLWARVPAELADGFRTATGAPLEGLLGSWDEPSRRIWSEGSMFTEDLGLLAVRLVPEPLGAGIRSLVNGSGLSKAAAVRLGERADGDLSILVAGDWLQPEDVPALRLFGAQLAAALEAARRVADLSRRNADLAVLDRVARRAGEATDLPGFLAFVSGVLRDVGCAASALYLFDEAAGKLVLTHSDGMPPEAVASLSVRGLDGALGEAMRERTAVVRDVGGGEAPDAQALGLPSVAAVPLLVRSKAVGLLAIGSRAPPAVLRSQLGLVSAVGAHVAAAIESHRLLDDLRARVEELSLLNDLGRIVVGSLDLRRVLDDGAEAARRLVGARRGFVLLLDAARSELRVAGSAGAPPELASMAAPVDSAPLVGEALRTGRPVAIADVLAQPIVDRYGVRGVAGRSAAVAPMVLHGEAVGVVAVDEAERRREFTPAELDRLAALANQLAVAIGNARLYAEARRRAEELGLIHEVGRELTGTLEFEQVLATGARNLARIVDAPNAYLCISSADGSALEVRAVAGNHPELLGLRLPLDPPGQSLAATVYRTREPIVIEDGSADPRLNSALRAAGGGRGYLALPLVVADRTLGAVIIIEPRRPRLFTPAEVERAADIANQLAVAADNARLFDDLRRSYAELERAQRQLVQRERLAALGEMSAAVAHEVRNPLGAIFNALGSLRRLVGPSGDARLLLDVLGEEADRLNRIVGDLLDFARPAAPELRAEPLDGVVEEALGAALAGGRSGVAVERELDPRLPPVPMDPRLVRQAVINLLENAVQAMPEGGRVVVRMRAEGDEAVLEVEDSGPGIPEDLRARIFEPFFTTKASGTGLGLAVVRRVVEGHGGTVAVRSGPGAGAAFTLRFPLRHAPVEKRPAIG